MYSHSPKNNLHIKNYKYHHKSIIRTKQAGRLLQCQKPHQSHTVQPKSKQTTYGRNNPSLLMNNEIKHQTFRAVRQAKSPITITLTATLPYASRDNIFTMWVFFCIFAN